jgi:hypothetical protein
MHLTQLFGEIWVEDSEKRFVKTIQLIPAQYLVMAPKFPNAFVQLRKPFHIRSCKSWRIKYEYIVAHQTTKAHTILRSPKGFSSFKWHLGLPDH